MFYAFNSNEFALKLKELRISLRLTQPQVSKFAKISVDGLRKIENGYVTPKFETLIKLSFLYKTNLIKLMSDYSKIKGLNDYYDDAQKLIDTADIAGLNQLKNELQEQLKEIFEEGIILHLEYDQFLIFCESSILFLKNTETDLTSAKRMIIEALRLSIEGFNEQDIPAQSYNQFELRLMHLLALVEKRMNNFDISIEILMYILSVSKADKNNLESIKAINLLYFSLSYSYFEKKDFENSLTLASKGIEFSIQYQRLNELHALYYRKGIAEYLLGDDNYLDSLNKSITLLDAVNSPLAKTYRDVSLEKYGIALK